MRTRRRPHWTAALIGVLTAACGGNGWLGDHPDVAARAQANPGAFVEPAFARWGGAITLSGAYQLRASRGIGRRTFDLAVSVQRPDRVDISVLDPTGAIQAFVRANPREVGLYLAEDRVLYRGPATREAFERALGLGLAAGDAVAVFLGYGVDRDTRGPGIAAWDDGARRVRVDWEPGSSLWLHPVQELFDHVRHRSDRGTLSAELLEWMEVTPESAPGGPAASAADMAVPVPSHVDIEVEPDGFGLELRLLAPPRLNHRLPEAIFEVQRVPGVVELPLDELAREGGLFRRGPADEEQS